MVCFFCISYMFMYLYNYLFIYFVVWRVDLKMMIFSSYWMIFRYIEVFNIKFNIIYLFVESIYWLNLSL